MQRCRFAAWSCRSAHGGVGLLAFSSLSFTRQLSRRLDCTASWLSLPPPVASAVCSRCSSCRKQKVETWKKLLNRSGKRTKNKQKSSSTSFRLLMNKFKAKCRKRVRRHDSYQNFPDRRINKNYSSSQCRFLNLRYHRLSLAYKLRFHRFCLTFSLASSVRHDVLQKTEKSVGGKCRQSCEMFLQSLFRRSSTRNQYISAFVGEFHPSVFVISCLGMTGRFKQ